MTQANKIFIESTGTKTRKTDKDKKDPKSNTKNDKSGKKNLMSPFKKIYNTSKDVARLKIKNKSKSAAHTTKKVLAPKT